MPQVESTLQSDVIDLARDALNGFCEDIGSMFGIEMSCAQVNVSDQALAEVKKNYSELAAVYSVKSSGALEGDFQILIDKAGVFTLGGVVVMLPESRILSNAKRGTLADANEMSDAVSEVGNLLIGCWARVFRDGLKNNTQFSHAGTFIGDPCKEGDGALALAKGEEATCVSFEISVGEYPSFNCAVYLPVGLFAEGEPEPEPEPVPESEAEPAAKAAEDVPIEPEPEPAIIPDETPDAEPEAEVGLDTEEDASVVVESVVQEEAPEPPEAESAPVPEQTLEPQALPAQTDDVQIEVANTSTTEPIEAVVQSASVNLGASLLAKHLMQTQVHWVTADDTVNEAQTKMQQIGASFLLVGDGAKLEGLVTQSDLAGAASIYLRPIFVKWRRPEDDATLQIRLKWIMSKQIYSVKPETPLSNIIHLKCKYGISCLPVVDVQGQVLGVVTTKDVFKSVVNKELCATGVSVL